jgi:hypothetical protein
MRIFLTVISRAIAAQLAKHERELAKLPREAYEFFKEITPRKTGNARRKTKLRNKAIIDADYPYAKRLDEGWSPKAPQGMSRPTIKHIGKKVRTIFK